MHAEPFTLADAERILRHPDRPASYVEWVEILPLTGSRDREHLGKLLGWSHAQARRPLGASRDIFARALAGIGDDTLDEWMASLARTPVEDFVDHHVPFIRNASAMPDRSMDATVTAFLECCAGPSGAGIAPPRQDRLFRPAPDSVIIEITRSCNFACTMCSSRTAGFLQERTMPLETFGEMVRVFSPGARTLRVNGFGETTLVPELDRYLDCLDEFGYRGMREIITNLSAPEAVYADLYERGFIMLVSWDATAAPLFESIRVGADYGAMLARLRALGRVARAQPERLGLLCTVQESNLKEIPPMVDLAAEVGAGLVIYNMVKEADGSPWMERRFEEIQRLFEEADGRAARSGVGLRIPDHVGRSRLRLRQTHRSSATFCDRPWRELLVNWDTEVTVCNMFNPFSYGTLQPPGPGRDGARRFARLWSGPNARLFRKIINSREPHPYCRDCYFLYA